MTTMASTNALRQWDTASGSPVYSSLPRSKSTQPDPVDKLLDEVRNVVHVGGLTEEILLARVHALQLLQCEQDNAWINDVQVPKHLRDLVWCRLAERAAVWIDLLETLAPVVAQPKRRAGLSRFVPNWLGSLLGL